MFDQAMDAELRLHFHRTCTWSGMISRAMISG